MPLWLAQRTRRDRCKTRPQNKLLLHWHLDTKRSKRHPDVIRCHFNWSSSVALRVVRYPSSERTRNATEVVRGSPNHFCRALLPLLSRSWWESGPFLVPSPLPLLSGRPAGAQLPAWPTTFPPDFRVNDTRSHSNCVMVTWATMPAYIAATFFKNWMCRVFRYSNFKN